MTTTMDTAEAAQPAHDAPAGATPESAEGFLERLSESMLGALDVLSVYLGDQLGLYDQLVDRRLTSAELAERAGVHERYAREWLEQQTVCQIVDCDDPHASSAQRRYGLSGAHAEVLADRDSLAYLVPFFRVIASSAVRLPALLEAYRSGGGVSWAQYGEAMRTGQADANRPLFLHEMGRSWLPSLPGVHQKLGAGGRVADIGCGEGWSAIAMALAYPNVRVDGMDLDAESIEAARGHAAAYGVGDRVRFHLIDAASAPQGDYDLVTAFECVHDMADPVAVLSAMRQLAAHGATVLVMDERVNETFTGEPDFAERLMYGLSLMVCLPDGMSHSPSAGTGTVMRPDTLRHYAEQAGFRGVDILPIEHELFRFYSLQG
ncbi:MAG TPA: class I SAM-dependent methyltransferase [Ornithinimicrobium sp.]|uniref:class I SAM-dependent methyltransferase n=1 Tax=Ornithinimicrobium sp. TaxID=1977084 RepID=UPI002B478BFA|nr:class I SAM-dependent methyltransferase [Ornithinimicrobium sp.]HKJ10796.1 class I SAM-dependent methyltransferase [Ornithinimicrobium sp.]